MYAIMEDLLKCGAKLNYDAARDDLYTEIVEPSRETIIQFFHYYKLGKLINRYGLLFSKFKVMLELEVAVGAIYKLINILLKGNALVAAMEQENLEAVKALKLLGAKVDRKSERLAWEKAQSGNIEFIRILKNTSSHDPKLFHLTVLYGFF